MALPSSPTATRSLASDQLFPIFRVHIFHGTTDARRAASASLAFNQPWSLLTTLITSSHWFLILIFSVFLSTNTWSSMLQSLCVI